MSLILLTELCWDLSVKDLILKFDIQICCSSSWCSDIYSWCYHFHFYRHNVVDFTTIAMHLGSLFWWGVLFFFFIKRHILHFKSYFSVPHFFFCRSSFWSLVLIIYGILPDALSFSSGSTYCLSVQTLEKWEAQFYLL